MILLKVAVVGFVLFAFTGCATFNNCRYEKEVGPTMVCSTPDTKGM